MLRQVPFFCQITHQPAFRIYYTSILIIACSPSPSLHHPSVLKIIRHRHRIPFPLISPQPPPVFGTLKKGHVRCVGDATDKTHELGVTKKKKCDVQRIKEVQNLITIPGVKFLPKKQL